MSQPGLKRAIGRPRRLTLDAIVDAACEIGIARLEMGLVAERLNTGVATLYGYVRGREHLLDLVTQKLAGQSLVKDRGQGWQDILREHAEVTSRLFESLPHLISNLMGPPDRHSVGYFQLILAMLVRRGVPMAVAADMFIETNQAVIGAAVSLMRRKALTQIGIDASGSPPHVPAILGDYRRTLERIIAGYEMLLADQGEDAA